MQCQAHAGKAAPSLSPGMEHALFGQVKAREEIRRAVFRKSVYINVGCPGHNMSRCCRYLFVVDNGTIGLTCLTCTRCFPGRRGAFPP
jgi:hypothetical protein